MPEDKIAKEAGDELAGLQGGGRPFSFAPLKPVAIIKRTQIRPLVVHLNLSPHVEDELINSLVKLMARYQGEKIAAKHHASNADSIELLESISRRSQRLAKDLTLLGQSFQFEIEQNRAENGDMASGRPIDLYQLVPRLEALSGAAARTKAASKPDPVGPKKKTLVAEIVQGMIPALTKAGLTIKVVKSGSAVADRYRIEDSGGDLMLATIRLFDRHVAVSEIYRAVRARKKGTKLRPTQNDRAKLAGDQ